MNVRPRFARLIKRRIDKYDQLLSALDGTSNIAIKRKDVGVKQTITPKDTGPELNDFYLKIMKV
jgi:hypothetical protein